MPRVLQSRKLWAAVVGLIFIIVNAVLNQQQIDPNTVTNAIMGIVAAYMGSVALEDGMTQRNATTTTVTTPGESNVTVTAPPDNAGTLPQPIIGRMGM